MPVLIQVRRGTSAEWAAANPVLHAGEPGLDTTTHRLKVGDGVTAWASLPTVGPLTYTDLGVAPVAQGGTGLASYAVGDLVYASGATTLAKLADVAVGAMLISGGVGVAPAWSVAGATGQSLVRDTGQASGFLWAERSRVLTVSTAVVGNDANANEKDLWSYAMPGGTLNADGRGLRITTWGSCAANGSAKSYRVYFGGTMIVFRVADTALNGFVWRAVVVLLRVTGTTQIADGIANQGPSGSVTGSTLVYGAAPGETLASPVTIRMTGQSAGGAANDIVIKGALVELLN